MSDIQVGQYRLKLGRDEIEKLLEGANEEKKRTIMKIIRAVVR